MTRAVEVQEAAQLWLSPQVHAVGIEEDLVFLDIASDAYLCLADAAQYFRIGPDGRINADPPQAADDLLEAGLLTTHGRDIRRLRPPPIARGLPVATPSLSASAIGAAIRSNFKAARAIQRLPFADILDLAEPLDTTTLVSPSSTLIDESCRFARMAPWLPRQGLCLMRSLQQRLYLQSRGLSAAWVFGVRTWPFEAHCWLQAGDSVLDDTPEHAGAYSPIFVI